MLSCAKHILQNLEFWSLCHCGRPLIAIGNCWYEHHFNHHNYQSVDSSLVPRPHPVRWHSTNPLGFITVDCFLQRLFQPIAEKAICGCNTGNFWLLQHDDTTLFCNVNYLFATMHADSYEFSMKPKELAKCHWTVSSLVGSGHKTSRWKPYLLGNIFIPKVSAHGTNQNILELYVHGFPWPVYCNLNITLNSKDTFTCFSSYTHNC